MATSDTGATSRPPGPGSPDRGLVASGILLGCGIAGSLVDLFIFHLILQWHHFYDLSTTRVALVSDGIFHAVTWLITVWGLFLLADVRRRGRVHWAGWAGAVLTGVGVFQLFDGVVNHKILGIHQVRYGVDLLFYDLAWIGSAILLIIAGGGVLWVTRVRVRSASSTACNAAER